MRLASSKDSLINVANLYLLSPPTRTIVQAVANSFRLFVSTVCIMLAISLLLVSFVAFFYLFIFFVAYCSV